MNCKEHARKLGAVSTLTALLLGACGTVSDPAAQHPIPLQAQALPSAFAYLHDLVAIPSTVSDGDLRTIYNGQIITRNVAAGTATIANDSSKKLKYDSALAVEANTRKFNNGTKAAGYSVWAVGYSVWATGYNVWATGATSPTTFTANDPIWAQVNLSGAQTLIPELGKGVKVAVIDTGIDMNHAAFSGKIDTVFAKDYIDGDNVPQDVNLNTDGTYSAGYGHGTAVAGIISQIAPNATILPIRVLDGSGVGDTASVADAITYAVNSGAKVINLSLGSTTDSLAVYNAVKDANNRNVPVIVAAGNSGDTNVLYPAARTLDAAGIGTGSMGVASVDTSFLKSKFSVYGSKVEFAAPGEKVMTPFPGGQSVSASGTSFATPMVSGSVALVLSTGITFSGADSLKVFLSNLANSSTPHTDPVYGTQLGKGTLNIFKFADIYR